MTEVAWSSCALAVLSMSVWMEVVSVSQISLDISHAVIIDDMLLTASQAALVSEVNYTGSAVGHSRPKRNIVKSETRLWELPVIYKLDNSFFLEDRLMIRKALEHVMDQTCIRFFEVDPQAAISKPHVMFVQHPAGCLSYVGRIPLDKEQPQLLSLPYYCLEMGTAVHEILHTLGVWHQHQRSDRDDFVVIHDDVISARYATNFRKSPPDGASSLGLPYDYSSVMHYGMKHGSVNDSLTITPKDRYYEGNLGQRLGLSFLDAKLLNTAYCQDKCSARLACRHGGYPDPKNCTTCRCPPGLAGHSCSEVAPPVGAKCGRRVFASPGETVLVTSPGFTEGIPYPDVVECNWLIEASASVQFTINFAPTFNILNPRDKDTCYNWIEIKSGYNFDIPGYRFCGSRRPSDNIIFYSSSVLFVFKSSLAKRASDESEDAPFRGFSITVSIETRKDNVASPETRKDNVTSPVAGDESDPDAPGPTRWLDAAKTSFTTSSSPPTTTPSAVDAPAEQPSNSTNRVVDHTISITFYIVLLAGCTKGCVFDAVVDFIFMMDFVIRDFTRKNVR